MAAEREEQRANFFDPLTGPDKAYLREIDYDESMELMGEAVADVGVTSMNVPRIKESSIDDVDPARDIDMKSELEKKPHLRDIISGKRVAGIALTAGAAVFIVGAIGYEALKHNHHHMETFRKLLHIGQEEPNS